MVCEPQYSPLHNGGRGWNNYQSIYECQIFWGVWKRDWRSQGDKDRLLCWPISSSSFDHTTPLSSRPHLELLLLGLGVLNPRRSQWLQAGFDFCWLQLSCSRCIYHFLTPTTSDNSRDYFHLFTQVCPIKRNLIDCSVYNKSARQRPRSEFDIQSIFFFFTFRRRLLGRLWAF